jgi:hypothetical protein
LFVFAYGEAEPLQVVVSAGAGHRKVLEIPARELSQGGSAANPSGEDAADPASSAVRADRSPGVSVKDVLVGVGFLLAVAAFVLSLRNARQLRQLQRTRPVP